MREKIDLGSDISILLAQLRRLAASRLGRKLQLGELIFVDPRLAQTIVDLDSAIDAWGDDELREEWLALRQRIIRKAALAGVRVLSESSRLFIAGAEEGGRKWGSSEEDEEVM